MGQPKIGSIADSLGIKRLELSEVFSADDPQVDIVLVHGLNGHPQHTWTAKNGVFWPVELLPKSLGAVRARILVYGYNADVYAFGGKTATTDYILDHAQTLVTNLESDRFNEDAAERPIIFVAHSLGGILVKRALEYSATLTSLNTLNLRSIFVSTYGIIFLGTPHNGADPAKWGHMLQSMCSVLFSRKILDTEPQLVTALQTQSETLQNINIGFLNIMHNFHICFFHEAVKTDLGVTQDFIVDKTSACPPLPGTTNAGIGATHSEMCKFESKNSPGYTAVSANVKRFAMDAPAKIAANWDRERASIEERRRRDAMELLGARAIEGHMTSSVSSIHNFLGPPAGAPAITSSAAVSTVSLLHPGFTTPPPAETPPKHLELMAPPPPSKPSSDPLVILPSGFRPNTVFVGMEREMGDLHRRLFDAKSRSRGAACVLLWCVSGGGKSHLARQYLFAHQHEFPSGVFWVRARSRREIVDDYLEIAQKIGLRDVPLPDPRSSVASVAAAPEDDDSVAEQVIGAVKDWFEAREGWLIVYDGIAIDQDADKAALQTFIPDSRNSSVLLTSVNKCLIGSRRLLSPVGIKVLPLDEQDACTLLFDEAGIAKPKAKEKEKALDIVRKVGRMPLAIHAIGAKIRSTGEPLTKYRVKPYHAEAKLERPFADILADLRRYGHNEALNLVSVLCFFGQHIPVEMVQLGIRAARRQGFEISFLASEGSGAADLNDTLSVLIRYALLERNDPDDSASQGSHPSLVETIDMLRMHTVVQTVMCSQLLNAGLLPQWLTYAVTLFSYSFAEADRRIKRQDGGGLLRDYREYEVHGKRLVDHVTRNLRSNSSLQNASTQLHATLLLIRHEMQRSTEGHMGHVSVFDRTSSTSDTMPETPREPSASELLVLGPEPSKQLPVDSPVDIADTPQLSWHLGLSPAPYEDAGYVSEIDYADRPKPARRVPYPETPSADSPLDSSRLNLPERASKHQHRTVTDKKRRRLLGGMSAWRHVLRQDPSAEPTLLTVKRYTEPQPDGGASTTNLTGEGLATSPARTALAAFQLAKPKKATTLVERLKLRRASVSDTVAQLGAKGSAAVPDVVATTLPELVPDHNALSPVTEPAPSFRQTVLDPMVIMPQPLTLTRIPSHQSFLSGAAGSYHSDSALKATELWQQQPDALRQQQQQQQQQQPLAPIDLNVPYAPGYPDRLPMSRQSSPGARIAHPFAASTDQLLLLGNSGSGASHNAAAPRWRGITTAQIPLFQSFDGFLLRPHDSKPSVNALLSSSLDDSDYTPSKRQQQQQPSRYRPPSSSMANQPAPTSDYSLVSGRQGAGGAGGLLFTGLLRRSGGAGGGGGELLGAYEYASEPMSREQSGQSLGGLSATGTEPARFPPHFSPPATATAGGTSSLVTPQPYANNFHTRFRSTTLATPTSPPPQPPFSLGGVAPAAAAAGAARSMREAALTPRSVWSERDLNGLGGWASSAFAVVPPLSVTSAAASTAAAAAFPATTMSSGGGIAMERASSGPGAIGDSSGGGGGRSIVAAMKASLGLGTTSAASNTAAATAATATTTTAVASPIIQTAAVVPAAAMVPVMSGIASASPTGGASPPYPLYTQMPHTGSDLQRLAAAGGGGGGAVFGGAGAANNTGGRGGVILVNRAGRPRGHTSPPHLFPSPTATSSAAAAAAAAPATMAALQQAGVGVGVGASVGVGFGLVGLGLQMPTSPADDEPLSASLHF